LFRQPALWLLFLASVGRGYLLLLSAHQFAHLVQVGFSGAFAATLAGLVGLLQAASGIASGWPVSRWGNFTVHAAATLAVAVGILSLAASQPSLLWLPILYLVFGASGRGALNVCQTSAAREQFGVRDFGKVAGLSEIGFAVGSFAGPSVGAIGHDLTGSYVPGLLTAIPAAMLGLFYTGKARAASHGRPDLNDMREERGGRE
jgi:MFS family permease